LQVIYRPDCKCRSAATSLESHNRTKACVAFAGVADRLWEIADIAKLVEEAEVKPAKRGPYKPAKA
jgi:hypothetical protein